MRRSASRRSRLHRLEPAAAGLLLLGVALSCLISPSNILMGLGFLVWIAAVIAGKARVRWAWIMAPLGFWVVWSFVSAYFSPEPMLSFKALDNLLTLLLVPMVLSLLNFRRWQRLLQMLAVISLLSSLIVCWQTIQTGIHLDSRAAGIFSHYMTYAGWTMAVLLILAGEALRARERKWWLWPLIAFHGMMLAVSLTRNAWVGLAAAMVLALLLWRPRPVLYLPLIIVVVTALLPPAVRSRISSITDLQQYANCDRKAMILSGLDMIRDHPLVGVGPDRIKRVYPSYRYSFAIRPHPSHLHDNPVHIAAERGLPALGAYLVTLLLFAFSVFSPLRKPQSQLHRVAASASLAILGLSCAGLFEYNWGDSEIWILTLFLLAVPSAPGLAREEEE